MNVNNVEAKMSVIVLMGKYDSVIKEILKRYQSLPQWEKDYLEKNKDG